MSEPLARTFHKSHSGFGCQLLMGTRTLGCGPPLPLFGKFCQWNGQLDVSRITTLWPAEMSIETFLVGVDARQPCDQIACDSVWQRVIKEVHLTNFADDQRMRVHNGQVMLPRNKSWFRPFHRQRMAIGEIPSPIPPIDMSWLTEPRSLPIALFQALYDRGMQRRPGLQRISMVQQSERFACEFPYQCPRASVECSLEIVIVAYECIGAHHSCRRKNHGILQPQLGLAEHLQREVESVSRVNQHRVRRQCLSITLYTNVFQFRELRQAHVRMANGKA